MTAAPDTDATLPAGLTPLPYVQCGMIVALASGLSDTRWRVADIYEDESDRTVVRLRLVGSPATVSIERYAEHVRSDWRLLEAFDPSLGEET